ncbi:MAG TPA: ATP phosphoribosyltransferase regulatory subunit [Usitatibacteraceae bacterium]|nr:ATP phosphoribosyltransferase regulatory subunit [Usitatibacteraceae bacterium]
MRRWLLPEHIEDILPAEARTVERLRRALLDLLAVHGYELVQPPLLEYTESLLSGTGGDLDLATFRLGDRLSGRQLGIRADHTPQVARIDAHLLNCEGVTRLAYCGSVLHTLPAGMTTTREPIQIGAELYGHAGLEADLEVLRLMSRALSVAGLDKLHLDIGHPRIYGALTAGAGLVVDESEALFHAVQQKDAPAVLAMHDLLGEQRAEAIARLTRLNGDVAVLDEARKDLPKNPDISQALDELARLAKQVAAPGLEVSFDLAELGGFNYESGVVFAAFSPASPDALARGGRYDEVGRSFGRARPATGFTMDLRRIASLVGPTPRPAAILAPCVEDHALDEEVARLRAAGEIVIADLPGHAASRAELGCDRILESKGGRWSVVPLKGNRDG